MMTDSCFKFPARGVKYLFPVQAKSFNLVYGGHDVIAQASKKQDMHIKHIDFIMIFTPVS